MIVKARTTTNRELVIDTLEKDSTVAELKERILEREGIPIDHQTLMFGGRMIFNDRTLEQCGIKDNDTVFLVNRLRPSPEEPNAS
jgi:hypothetical protein